MKKDYNFGEHSKVKMRKDHNGLRLEVNASPNWFMIFFATFWNGITFTVIYLVAFQGSGDFSFDEFHAGHILMITHPTIGLLVAYGALASLINKTRIHIDHRAITVKVGPLPIRKANKRIHRQGVGQIYIDKYIAYTQNESPVYRYQLMANDITLVKGIKDSLEAEHIESLIESYLGIQNDPSANQLEA